MQKVTTVWIEKGDLDLIENRQKATAIIANTEGKDEVECVIMVNDKIGRPGTLHELDAMQEIFDVLDQMDFKQKHRILNYFKSRYNIGEPTITECEEQK